MNPLPRLIVLLSLLFLTPVGAFAKTLSEAEFVRAFLEKNPRVEGLRLNPKVALQEERGAKGDFDPLLFLEGHYFIDQTAKGTTVFGTDNRELTYQAGLEKKWSSGLQSKFSLRTDRETTDSPFATVSPSHEPRLALDLRQNFLQNAFGFSDRRLLSSNALLTESASLSTRSDLEGALAGAIASYWRLVSAQNFLKTNREFVKTANEFVRAVNVKKELGTAEDTDVYAARALLLSRENDLTEAKKISASAVDEVVFLIQGDVREPIVTREEASVPNPRTLDEEVLTALSKRGDLAALKQELKARGIRVESAKNLRLPVIDLVTSLTLNGLTGDHAEALADAFTADNAAFFGGMEVAIPIPNRKGGAATKIEELRRLQVLFRTKELEDRVVREVREAHRNLAALKTQVARSAEISRLHFQKWDAERKKFALGRSNSDTVIRYEKEWVEARWRLIEAELKGRMAWIELRRSVGDLLEMTVN